MANDNLLLNYALSTAPSPLQVSASLTQPSAATITIVVSCPPDVGSANVSQLVVALPVRDNNAPDSSELAMVPPPEAAASILSTGSDQWRAAPGAVAGVFTFTPKGGPVDVAAQRFTIAFRGIEVSPLIGTAQITITEWASATGAAPSPSGAPSATGSIALAKFPVGFFADSFTGPTEVDSGGTATLTWNASSNASCVIEYEKQQVQVAGESWTSPALYGDTVFKLIASATQNRQTVSIPQSTIVQVANPAVVTFQPLPDAIDVGQSMLLTWTTTSADGVYLLSSTGTGATKREQTWPAFSDNNKPVNLTPVLGTSYSLQAYKTLASGGEAKSAAFDLEFSYLPVDIRGFTAEPAVVTDLRPNTLLTWEVANAATVTLQGAKVDFKGSRPDNPRSDTTYTLAATGVDGSQKSKTAPVKSRKIISTAYQSNAGDVSHNMWRGGNVTIWVKIFVRVAAENSVVLDQVRIYHGQMFNETALAAQAAPGEWIAMVEFELPAMTAAMYANTPWTVQADIVIDGEKVPSVQIPPG